MSRQTSLKLGEAIHTVELTEWQKATDAPGQLQVLLNDEERSVTYQVLDPSRIRLLLSDRTV